MRTVIRATGLSILFSVLPLSVAWAGTCIDGACHGNLLERKYLHGPVAAEQAGVQGCVMCHIPAGAPCSATGAGSYRFKTKTSNLCLMCHEAGTSSQHTRARGRCLSCHDPHGSNASNKMMKAG